MDQKLEEIIRKGKVISESTTEEENKSLGNEIKERIVGDQAYFEFHCPKCDTGYQTKNKYKTEGNYFGTMGRYKAESAITGFIRDVIGIDMLTSIPVIGPILQRRYVNTYDDKEQAASDKIEGGLLYKYQKAAFEEVKNKFTKARNEDSYRCEACINS